MKKRRWQQPLVFTLLILKCLWSASVPKVFAAPASVMVCRGLQVCLMASVWHPSAGGTSPVQGVAPPSSGTAWMQLTGPLWAANCTLLRSWMLPCCEWLSRCCDPPCRDWLSSRTELLCCICSWRRDTLLWGRQSSSAPRTPQAVYLHWEMDTMQGRWADSAALTYILFAFHVTEVTVLYCRDLCMWGTLRDETLLSGSLDMCDRKHIGIYYWECLYMSPWGLVLHFIVLGPRKNTTSEIKRKMEWELNPEFQVGNSGKIRLAWILET